MFDSLKRLTKHSFVYGIGHIISRMVNFLLLPLYTNVLTSDEFGASAVLFTFLAVLFILYTYGLDAAFMRYFILSDSGSEKKRIFSTTFWGIFFAVLVFSGLMYVFKGTIASLLYSKGNYEHLVALAGFILFFDALAVLPFLYLRAQERSVFYTTLKFINVLLNIGFNIYFIVSLQKGVEGIFLANAWASGLTLVMLLGIIARNVSFHFDVRYFRELFAFGLPYLPATLSIVLLDVIDRVILEKMVGLEATGNYHAGVKLGMFMALFVAAFRFAWQPFFLSTSKQEDAKEIFSHVLTYFTTAACVVFLVIAFFINDIVQFRISGITLIGEKFWPGLEVVPYILIAYLISGVYVNFTVGIQLKKKTLYMPLITGAGVFTNVALNLSLIPVIGILGAAYAKIAGYVVMSGMLYYYAQKFYPIDYDFKRLLKLAAVGAAVFFTGSLFDTQILFRVALIIVFPVILMLVGFFERRELHKIKVLLSRG